MRFAKRSNHEVLATEREPEGQAKRSNAGGNVASSECSSNHEVLEKTSKHESAANAYRRRRLPNKKPHHDVAPATNGGERVNTSECSSKSEHFIGNECSTKTYESSTKNHERSTMQKQPLLLGFNALPKNILIFPTFPKRFTLPTFPRHSKKFTQRSPSRVLTAVADSHRRFL